jgi:hypothetical protein
VSSLFWIGSRYRDARQTQQGGRRAAHAIKAAAYDPHDPDAALRLFEAFGPAR